jgi:3-phytase
VFAAHSLMKKFMVFMGPAFLAIMVATCGASGQGKSGGEGNAEERPVVPVVERTETKKEDAPADAAGRGEEQNRNEQASGNNNDGGGGGQANGGGGGPAGDRAGAGVVVPAPGAYATLETSPVPHVRDAADDAAIWRDATDPARSTVIGTDKRGGVAVYDSQTGSQIQYTGVSGEWNNVDLRDGFSLGGESVSLVVASRQDNKALGVWKVVPASRQLVDVTAGITTTLDNNYGLCLGKAGGETYAYVNSEAGGGNDAGEVEQWRLRDDGSGRVTGTMVRTFDVGMKTEGCVVDESDDALYIGEEDIGIWRYSSLPSGGDARTKIAGMPDAGGNLVADVEGLTIAGGHLLASSQGESKFASYALPGGAYEGEFAINVNPSGKPDAVNGTDGIAATAKGLGAKFPNGVFVAQDTRNTKPRANQNFKLVPFDSIFPAE